MKRDFPNVPGQEGTLEQRLWRMAFETLMPQEEVDPETASRLERGRSSLEEFTSFTMPEFQINWHHHVLFEHLEALVRGDILRLMVFMPPQHGKQIADKESILCADGWRQHGDLRPGHLVYAPDGRLVPVLAVTQPLDCDLEIELTTGEVLVTHSNHRWHIYDRAVGGWRILTTADMARRRICSARRCTFQFANETPLQGVEQSLAVHPYALGLWLGDGSTDKGVITYTFEDVEVATALVACGYPLQSTWVHADTGVPSSSFAGLLAALEDAGVAHTKHIPEKYLLGSFWQRRELLAGLIDSDGSYSADSGQYRFINTNARLMEQVVWLARSLGYRVGSIQRYEPCLSSSGIQGTKDVLVIAFSASAPLPCRLARKRPRSLTTVRRRGIVDIRPCQPQPGRCITVQGGLYLVGETLVPTHNSESVSRRLPAYTLGRYPDEKIIACSYNDHFAGLMNRDVQRIIDSDLYKQLFPGTELFSKNIRTQSRGTYLRNSDIFEVVGRKGSYRSAGIGGGIGGMPFTLGIIDDPIKDDKEANSPTIREAIWNWYTTVFSARKAKARARILITLTRWHQDDLAGRLLHLAGSNSGADQWVVVEFPAILEDETQRHQTRFGADPRHVGEALWEDRHPLKELQVERIQAGAVKWSAVFQQNPTPAKGVVFTRATFRYFSVQRDDAGVLWVTLPPRAGAPPEEGPRRCRADECQFWQTCDTADQALTTSAFTCVMTLARTPWRDLLLWHVWRARLEFPERYRAILGLRPGLGHWSEETRQWRMLLLRPWPRPLLYQAVEEKASGIAIIQQGAADGFPFRSLRPGKQNKVERCAAVATLYDAGKVFHFAGQPWLGTLESELLAFPGGTYADQVDCLAYGGILLTQDALLGAPLTGELLIAAPGAMDDGLPRNAQGQIVLPPAPHHGILGGILGNQGPEGESYQVGQTDVYFPDRTNWWED